KQQMTIEKVLILDEKSPHHIVLHELLRKRKSTYLYAPSLVEGFEKLQHSSFDLLFYNPQLAGLEGLKQIKEKYPLIPVILITEQPHIEETVEAMQLGAHHCLQLPLNPEPLILLLNRLQAQINEQRESAYLEQDETVQSEQKKHLLIVESAMM